MYMQYIYAKIVINVEMIINIAPLFDEKKCFCFFVGVNWILFFIFVNYTWELISKQHLLKN